MDALSAQADEPSAIAHALSRVCQDSFAAPQRRKTLRCAVLAGLFCLLIYNANLRAIDAGDTYSARYLPFAIWHWHTVFLDPILDITTQGWKPIEARKPTEMPKTADPAQAFWAVRLPSGHTVSLYPVTAPVLLAPLYLPAAAYLSAVRADPLQMDRIARIMEKLSASLVASLSAALLYLLIRRRTDQRWALLLTLAYALGTTTWVISSQALWQHGLGELLVVCALLILSGPSGRARAAAAGLVLGLIACNRPPDALIAAALGLYGLWWAKRNAPLLMVGTAAPLVPLLFYNLVIVGHYAGAYGLVGDPSFFQHNPLSGLAGLLFSPTKGLFIFSPFLIFVPLSLPVIFRDPRERGLTIAGLAAVVLQLVVYSAGDWRQGASWGPRWITDLIPILIWLLAPVVTAMSVPRRAVFAAAVFAAVAIEAIGAFWYTGASNKDIYASGAERNPMRSAWEVRNAPFIAELRHDPAPFELAANVRGYVDVMTIGYGARGRQVELMGWALANGRSPAEVVALLDGLPAASSNVFGPRPDVAQALGAGMNSGWTLQIPAGTASTDEHSVTVLVRANPNGETRWLTTRRLPSRSDLEAAARRAADAVAAGQQQPGYWLTSFTNRLRFEDPGVEMNTYLPSVMVDLLEPVAKDARLEAHLQRARQFLTRQIEAGGLVRYHGRPDAPTIGTLGCAITPDTDDTSLIWRIAPSPRTELLRPALEKIREYRTTRGLYRTWLAPQARYECIDPGSDPDPADFTIQIHVLMLLAKADPPAARELCAALRGVVDDDRGWVYYKSAPVVPILRQADLREAGCALTLPASRRQTAIEGQQVWISAAKMLDRARGGGQRPPRSEARELLAQLAEDDFLLIRKSPPLLYHNDQTASVSRFYWSREYGYALWLRLYYEAGEGRAVR